MKFSHTYRERVLGGNPLRVDLPLAMLAGNVPSCSPNDSLRNRTEEAVPLDS